MKKQLYEGRSSRSELPAKIDLVPGALLRAAARRLTFGAERHGEGNWEKGREGFVDATKAHLLSHVIALVLDSDRSDDHIGAICANAAFLAHFEEAGIDVYRRRIERRKK